MFEFLAANWLWMAIVVAFVWMHSRGGGCGSHGSHGSRASRGHSDDRDASRRDDISV